MLKELARELRQFNGLGATYFRLAAGRLGMTVTDMQVIDMLESAGPTTAGQLAEFAGLTTGAITGMINRLEEAGLVRRERDPEDARRVIVRLNPDQDKWREIGPMFAAIEREWDELAASYDDEQVEFLLTFLQRSNAIARNEIARLRESPEEGRDRFTAPLGDFERARLVIYSGFSGLTLRADDQIAELYKARFDGVTPSVKVKDGEVTIRYPRRLWMLGGQSHAAEVALNTTLPWWITIQGGASEIDAKLSGLDLGGLQLSGAVSMVTLDLPSPTRTVEIRISGGASEVVVRRPAGVAAAVHLKGWASTFAFDDQSFSNVGNDVRLKSPGYDSTDLRYNIEVSSSVSTVTISQRDG